VLIALPKNLNRSKSVSEKNQIAELQIEENATIVIG
jgi:hypothetical protein